MPAVAVDEAVSCMLVVCMMLDWYPVSVRDTVTAAWSSETDAAVADTSTILQQLLSSSAVAASSRTRSCRRLGPTELRRARTMPNTTWLNYKLFTQCSRPAVYTAYVIYNVILQMTFKATVTNCLESHLLGWLITWLILTQLITTTITNNRFSPE